MPDPAGLFEVGVGEGARRVGHGDQLSSDLRRERLPPQEVSRRREPHAAGSEPGRIVSADTGGWRWDDFGQASRSRGNAAAEYLEVIQCVAHVLCDADPVLVRMH